MPLRLAALQAIHTAIVKVEMGTSVDSRMTGGILFGGTDAQQQTVQHCQPGRIETVLVFSILAPIAVDFRAWSGTQHLTDA